MSPSERLESRGETKVFLGADYGCPLRNYRTVLAALDGNSHAIQLSGDNAENRAIAAVCAA